MERKRGLKKLGRKRNHKVSIPTSKELRVMDLSAGIGGNFIALDSLNIDYNIVAIAETDEYRLKVYNKLYGETRNLGNLENIEYRGMTRCDLLLYSINNYDVKYDIGKIDRYKKVISKRMPRYLVLESTTLIKNKKEFENLVDFLSNLGYNNNIEVLNAKDFGLPHNMQRLYMVSVLKGNFEFPNKNKESYTIRDIFEDYVYDEEHLIGLPYSKLIKRKRNDSNSEYKIYGKINYDSWLENQKIVYSLDSVAPAIFYSYSGKMQIKVYDDNLKIIRELIPIEYFRLMGFSDELFLEIEEELVSDTRLYKTATEQPILPIMKKILQKIIEEKIE